MELKLKSLLCLLICTSFSTTSFSATRTWDGTAFFCGSNDFSSPACWTAFTVPGSADTANFSSSGGGGTVNFSLSTTNRVANVSRGYTWQLNSNQYTVSSFLRVNNNAGLNLTNGTVDAGAVSIFGGARIVTTTSATTNGRLIAADLSLQSGGELFSDIGFVGFVGGGSGGVLLGSGSSANTTSDALVTGTGSKWDTGLLTVGNSRALTVSSGGFVDVASKLTVQDAGRVVTTGGGRIEAGEIRLQSNGDLFSTNGRVGGLSTAPGSVSSFGDATVTGTGSKWDTSTLTVLNRTTLTTSSGGFVDVAGSLTVQDAGRVDTTGGGRIEAGGLRIQSDGDLFSSSGFVGSSSSALGSVASIGNALVTGSSSNWNTGTLTVLNSRSLTLSSGSVVNATGRLTIQDSGRVMTTNGRLIAGEIRIESNGDLFSTIGRVGLFAPGALGSAISAGDALVTGTGSEWDTGSLTVLNSTTLTASSGGLVDVAGRLTVQSAGRVVTTSSGRIEAGEIKLQNNGDLFSTIGFVGSSSTALGSVSSLGNATVLGTGSEWDTGSLTVTNSRVLTASSDGFVDVAGTLAIQSSARAVTVSGRIEAGSLTLSSNGDIFSTHGVVGDSSGLSGSIASAGDALVTGTGSKWDTGSLRVTNGRTLTVSGDGFVDVDGRLTLQTGRAFTIDGGRIEAGEIKIQNNGDLFSSIGFVGSTSTASGSATSIGDALVGGTGSEWDTESLTVTNGRTLTVSSSGFVDVARTLKIQNSGRTFASRGRIEAGTLRVESNGGLFSNNGRVGSPTSANGSVNSIGNATVTGSGSLWRSNTLAVGNGRTLFVEDSALVDVVRGLNVTTNAHLQVNNATVNASTINVTGAGSLLNMTAATVNADVSITNASLTGTGTITGNVSGIGAAFGPGNSPGLLTIDGDFSQDINSSILFELAGVIAESEYDVLDISGIANLAGELVIDWFDNGGGLFSASEGDVFDILSAETIIGEFDLLSLAVLSEGLGWEVSYLIDEFGTTDVLRLSVIGASAVPVPASVWLFGSGLLGLIGVARRKPA